MVNLSKWWKYDKKEIMSQIYWFKDQLPPFDPEKYEAAWEQIKANLTEQYGGEQ